LAVSPKNVATVRKNIGVANSEEPGSPSSPQACASNAHYAKKQRDIKRLKYGRGQ